MSFNNLILFLILVINIVSAKIDVLTPNETSIVVVNEPFLITWTSSDDDPKSITIAIKDPKNSVVGKSIETSSGKLPWNINDSSLVGDNRVLQFYDASSYNVEIPNPIAKSKGFSIKSAGYKPPEPSKSPELSKPPERNDSPKNVSSCLFIFLASLISLIIYF